MTNTELNRAIAKATGETIELISNRGFSPLFLLECDEPQSVDWDELDDQRSVGFMPRRRRTTVTI